MEQRGSESMGPLRLGLRGGGVYSEELSVYARWPRNEHEVLISWPSRTVMQMIGAHTRGLGTGGQPWRRAHVTVDCACTVATK
jgi:hypothetical protein